MFQDYTEKLSDGIYLYKNFISKDECQTIVDYLDSLPEDKWRLIPNRKDEIKMVNDVTLLLPAIEKIKSMLDNGYIFGQGSAVTRMVPGDFWGVHADVHDFEHILKASNEYIDGMPYEEQELSVFGTVLYLNSADGGEIFYPRQNIIHKQSPGDLVIHSAGPETEHGVNEVMSGKRYAHSNNIRKLVRIPKYI